MSPLPVPTVNRPIHGTIRPPGSKSLTNRALVCAALASGTSRLIRPLDSDDTRYMLQAVRQLGVRTRGTLADPLLEVDGCAGRWPATQADLYVGNSGTCMRFLTAVCALGQGRYRLDGNARMRERPISDLLEAMRALGVEVHDELHTGAPPVVVRTAGLAGGRVSVRGDVSSQFLSGLLLAAPYSRAPVVLDISGTLVSRPYVDMTLAVMASFGVQARWQQASLHVPQGCYRGCDYQIEPDASAASYFLAAAAITGGNVTIDGLGANSLQGDVAFAHVLQQMGCRVQRLPDRLTLAGGSLKGVDVDMKHISDTVPTLAVVALFADGPTTISGVEHVRHKETDRLHALATELRKLGAIVEERPDGLRITPTALHGAQIDTYDDHRMAMSLALAGLRTPGVVISHPECTAKTYPGFFDDLFRLAGA